MFDLAPKGHLSMVTAVAPYIDGAFAKTVNPPEDFPFDDSEPLYPFAWTLGLQSMTVFRPHRATGHVMRPVSAHPR